jgi:hypothetical protein
VAVGVTDSAECCSPMPATSIRCRCSTSSATAMLNSAHNAYRPASQPGCALAVTRVGRDQDVNERCTRAPDGAGGGDGAVWLATTSWARGYWIAAPVADVRAAWDHRRVDRLLLILLVLVVITFACSVLLRQIRLRWISRVGLSDDEANLIRAELLEYVKSNSFGEGHEVSLVPFWRKRRLNEADKRYIAGPLFEDRILLVTKEVCNGSTWQAMFEKMSEVWVEKVLMPLPQKVLLNPQVYYRMLHEGISAGTIIMEQFVDRQVIDDRVQSFHADVGAQVSGVTLVTRRPSTRKCTSFSRA